MFSRKKAYQFLMKRVLYRPLLLAYMCWDFGEIALFREATKIVQNCSVFVFQPYRTVCLLRNRFDECFFPLRNILLKEFSVSPIRPDGGSENRSEKIFIISFRMEDCTAAWENRPYDQTASSLIPCFWVWFIMYLLMNKLCLWNENIFSYQWVLVYYPCGQIEVLLCSARKPHS